MGHHIGPRTILLLAMAAFAMTGCKAVIATYCGDGYCDRDETSLSCPRDCSGTVCGDRICEAGENCATCAGDCGVCTGCNDGTCNSAAGETCATCPNDCGACSGADPYESCGGGVTCTLPRDTCFSVSNRGVTRAFCSYRHCTTENDCDTDMFGSRGLCVSFDSGSTFDCYHRCNDSSDCYPGFACYATGSGMIATNVCLPDAGPPPSVAPYRICTSSAECSGGLQCDTFTVGSASTRLCSLTGCVTDNDCPLDARGGRGACLNFGGTSACWEWCSVRGDCANTTQFDCTRSVGAFTSPVNVCVVR